jgi:hypothetical protein
MALKWHPVGADVRFSPGLREGTKQVDFIRSSQKQASSDQSQLWVGLFTRFRISFPVLKKGKRFWRTSTKLQFWDYERSELARS